MNDQNKMPSVIALGMFDGLHIGHRAVLAEAVRIAREIGAQSVAYTFLNHPRSVFAVAPTPLMTAEKRRAAMCALGIDVVDMVPFDRALAELSPAAFLDMLAARYDIRAIVAGEDFTFGHFGAGTVDTIRDYAAAHGFSVACVPFVMLDGAKVSSTRIREAQARGDTELVRRMMG